MLLRLALLAGLGFGGWKLWKSRSSSPGYSAGGVVSQAEAAVFSIILPSHAAWLIEPTLQACRAHDVSPFIMFGVLKLESDFGRALTLPDGRKGATGPETAAGASANGEDLGPFQINRRAHAEFVGTGAWRNIHSAADYATKLMASNLRQAKNYGLVGDALIHAGIAAYNTGWGNVRKSLDAGASPDRTTAHGIYGKTVMDYAAQFKDRFTAASRAV